MSQNSVIAGGGSVAQPSRRALTGKRILVVDSSEVCRKMLANALQRRAANVVVECGSDDALLSVIRNHPDAVIAGIEIGRISGYDLKAIRRQARYAKLPILMITTEGGAKEVAEARAAGVTEHLRKPFSVQRVIEAIAAAGLTVAVPQASARVIGECPDKP